MVMKTSLLLLAASAMLGVGVRADTPPTPRPSSAPSPMATAAPPSRAPRKAEARPSTKPGASPAATAASGTGAAGGKVYTNEDLPKEPSPPPVAPAGSAGSGRGTVTVLPEVAAPENLPAGVADTEPPLAPEATEGYWRQRADERRGAITSGEQRVTELEQRITDLRMDRTTDNALDPNREQNRQANIAEAQAELESARAALEGARRALAGPDGRTVG